jgi:predicted ArsR family transcriptional regulator
MLSSVLASAMSHPTRLEAMTILLRRPASPSQIAAELEQPLSNVSYHVDQLVKFGCIRLARTEPAGGGRVVQHVYEAVDRVYFDADSWDRLGRQEKLKVAIALMRLVSEDINEAMAQMTFFEPDDNHLSRSPMDVDGEGWEEVVTLLDGVVDSLFEIQGNVAARCADGGGKTFPIKVEIMQFRSPEKAP